QYTPIGVESRYFERPLCCLYSSGEAVAEASVNQNCLSFPARRLPALMQTFSSGRAMRVCHLRSYAMISCSPSLNTSPAPLRCYNSQKKLNIAKDPPLFKFAVLSSLDAF